MSVEIHYGGRVYPLAYTEATVADVTAAVRAALMDGKDGVFYQADTTEGPMSFLIGASVPFAVREVKETTSVYEDRGLMVV